MKFKPLNLILHVVQMQHTDIKAMPTKIKTGKLRIVTVIPFLGFTHPCTALILKSGNSTEICEADDVTELGDA